MSQLGRNFYKLQEIHNLNIWLDAEGKFRKSVKRKF